MMRRDFGLGPHAWGRPRGRTMASCSGLGPQERGDGLGGGDDDGLRSGTSWVGTAQGEGYDSGLGPRERGRPRGRWFDMVIWRRMWCMWPWHECIAWSVHGHCHEFLCDITWFINWLVHEIWFLCLIAFLLTEFARTHVFYLMFLAGPQVEGAQQGAGPSGTHGDGVYAP